jgi:hypothetical protein
MHYSGVNARAGIALPALGPTKLARSLMDFIERRSQRQNGKRLELTDMPEGAMHIFISGELLMLG